MAELLNYDVIFLVEPVML